MVLALLKEKQMAAFIGRLIQKCGFVVQSQAVCSDVQHAAIRNYYTDWRMIKDLKRRNTVKKYATERMRINCIRKNKILPENIRQIADVEIARDFPRDSWRVHVTNRCAVTSRSRGVFFRWRLSRIMFRHLADYNYLSGAQRAMW